MFLFLALKAIVAFVDNKTDYPYDSNHYDHDDTDCNSQRHCFLQKCRIVSRVLTSNFAHVSFRGSIEVVR